MARTFQLCLLLAGLLLHSYAEAKIERLALACGNAICPRWWPELAPPKGWVHDRTYSAHYNVNAVCEEGKSFKDAEVVMYANAVFKPRVPQHKTLEEFIAGDLASFRTKHQGLVIKQSSDLKTSDGKQVVSWTLDPSGSGQWERTAYLEEGDFYIVFVISSRSQAGRDSQMQTFEQWIASYKE
jgi:hypothetical protein